MILFIHSSVKHLGCFHYGGTIMDNSVNVSVQVCGHMFSFLLSIYLRVELLGHMLTYV